MKLFICHASEDKESFVNTLVSNLGHLNYFYDIYSLKIGDEITGVINEEIQNSTGAIVVISASFLKKDYPKNEFKLLIHKKMSNEDYKIFPIFLGDVKKESQEKFPVLNNLWSLTGLREEASAKNIAEEILNKLHFKTSIKDQESLEVSSKMLIESLSKLKDWNEILSKRYGIGHRYMTLREIGEELNLTRERIRQREQDAEEKLRECCVEDETLKIFTENILSKIISSDELSLTTLEGIIAVIKYPPTDDITIKQIIKLILNVNGYMELINTYGVNTIFVKCGKEIVLSEVVSETSKIIDYLRYNVSTPISVNVLKEKLTLKLPLSVLRNLLNTYEFIENDNELFSVKFSDLGKLSAMAERVLFNLKAPAKAGTILEEIRLKSLNDQELLNKLDKRLLIQQMSFEKERFFTNKKGLWGISENKNEIKEYSSLLLNILKKHKIPVDGNSLINEISALDVDEKGKRSMKVYLTTMKEIQCLIAADGTSKTQYYILSENNFDEKKFSIRKKRELKKPRKSELLQEAKVKINAFFDSKSVDGEVRLKDLAKYLQKKMKLRRIESAYGYIKKSELVEYDRNIPRDMKIKLIKIGF